MNNTERRERRMVVAEALTWKGTPYHLNARVKGAGVDCGTFLIAAFSGAGLIEDVDLGAFAHDFHLHRGEEVYEEWLRRVRAHASGRRPPPPPRRAARGAWGGGTKSALPGVVTARVTALFFARARKFRNAREAALFENHVPVKVYDQLIEAIHRNLPKLHQYISVRKRILGLEEMHMYDLYVPLIPSVNKEIDYAEARKLVVESLEPLGEDYVGVVRSAFDQGWIDVWENAGKRGGAYSWGTYDSKPYILMNYQSTLDSVFTLTHEMGHSMHSYMTHHRQPYLYGHYSIFLAEVASTTNEALLNDYLLKRVKDKAERLHLLNHYLDQFRTTVFRQAMFAEFERDIHAALIATRQTTLARKAGTRVAAVESCRTLDRMVVSAGKVGLQVELTPADLIELTLGETASLTKE